VQTPASAKKKPTKAVDISKLVIAMEGAPNHRAAHRTPE
jgi:hypothetical protein